MNAPHKALLIISRDALLASLEEGQAEKMFRLLAGLTRQGHRIILTAPEPDRWVPTRRKVDQALVDQQALMKGARAAGGDLDGVYYVPRSLLTQDRNRSGALRDILARYGEDAATATLISSSTPFLKAAKGLGLETRAVAPPGKAGDSLADILETLTGPKTTL